MQASPALYEIADHQSSKKISLFNPTGLSNRVAPFSWGHAPMAEEHAFSKKWGHLQAALALHFCYYNYCRVHRSLKATPAMAAGLTDRVWTIGDLVS